ncbi:MAG: 4-hydroxy-tetrahydrodipicolinate reductase [Kiloniellaceae bacterium]
MNPDRVAPYRVAVTGCAGRMGRMNLAAIQAAEGCVVAGGSDQPGSPAVGRDIGELIGAGALGIVVGDDPVELFAAADAVIDFTTPAATRRHAELAAQAEVVYVVGTTGLAPEDQAVIDKAAIQTVVVQAANMSLGVNLLQLVTEQVARALDADYDIEIVEMHHRHKVDAPSGTALMLGEAAARGRGVALAEVARMAREGQVGARPRGEIGFATLRGGDVPGEHSVIFAAEGERLVLTHKAGSREVFAKGAVKAALWGRGKPAGLYSMRDVLGLTD